MLPHPGQSPPPPLLLLFLVLNRCLLLASAAAAAAAAFAAAAVPFSALLVVGLVVAIVRLLPCRHLGSSHVVRDLWDLRLLVGLPLKRPLHPQLQHVHATLLFEVHALSRVRVLDVAAIRVEHNTVSCNHHAFY